MVEAVVFDMDGVIVDTEQYWIEEEPAILDAALPEGHSVAPQDITGIQVHEQFEMLAEEYEMQVSRDEYFELFDEVAERVYERADLLPGFHDVLDSIEERGLPIGLATSSYPRWIEIVFEAHDLQDRFDAVVSADEIDAAGKPEPDIYETVASRLGVDPSEMLVVEDSESGIEAGARSGAYTIAYAAHGVDDATDRSMADEVIEDAERLRERVIAILDEDV